MLLEERRQRFRGVGMVGCTLSEMSSVSIMLAAFSLCFVPDLRTFGCCSSDSLRRCPGFWAPGAAPRRWWWSGTKLYHESSYIFPTLWRRVPYQSGVYVGKAGN